MADCPELMVSQDEIDCNSKIIRPGQSNCFRLREISTAVCQNTVSDIIFTDITRTLEALLAYSRISYYI